MKVKILTILLVYFLLSFSLLVPVIACTPPSCPGCCTWLWYLSDCFDRDYLCGGCCHCEDCSCVPYYPACNPALCYECEYCGGDLTKICCDGSCCNNSTEKCCNDKGGDIDGYCCPSNKTCCKGACCDPCDCETCLDGVCKKCGGDPNQKCCDGCCISLSNGCEYAGAHDSSVHWINPYDDYFSTTVPPFGAFDFDMANYEADFKYNNCSWVCEINNVNAETIILVRAPSSLPDMNSVSQASDVPCVDANLAKFDLNDPNLTDDDGAPRTKYWSNVATILHEQKHRADWQQFYEEELANAIACSESLQSSIDCGDPNTITCQAAENYWKTWIQDFFQIAWEKARKSMNNPDTPVNEADVRAYEVSYMIEQPISAALPGGCTP